MSVDISGFGLELTLKASNTFPAGIQITQFADDADPFDAPSIQIMDKGMGINGDLVVWSVATPTTITLSVIPASEDDKNLEILLENNRVKKGGAFQRDSIDLTAKYPDGKIVNLMGGAITDGIPVNSAASAGRLKSRTYAFVFESSARS
ncbi:MAG: hypothetical protein LBJ76_04080 [Candidatus Accumulibacter sp.]|jgi:hypothetical protein|nr:hypothetical protein [Accumulibacter sp.]